MILQTVLYTALAAVVGNEVLIYNLDLAVRVARHGDGDVPAGLVRGPRPAVGRLRGAGGGALDAR